VGPESLAALAVQAELGDLVVPAAQVELENLVARAVQVASEDPAVPDLVKERALVPVVEAEVDPAPCRPIEAVTLSADEAHQGAGVAVLAVAAWAGTRHARRAAEVAVAWEEEVAAAEDAAAAVVAGDNNL